MTALSDVLSLSAKAIGRYFSIVSALPSLLFVVFVYVLITSGAWSGPPDWTKAWISLTKISIGEIAGLIVATIGVSVATHALQFALVQFFEGYWGVNELAQELRARRIECYKRYAESLQYHEDDEGLRLRDRYPDDPNEIMPTRLGNILRRHERLAGRPYELDAVVVVPRLAMVAPTDHVDYLDDQRAGLDLAVRTTMIALVAATFAVVFLWRHGLWLLVALIPYAVAYLGYRGAVVAAEDYCVAFTSLIDVDRFILYDHMRLPQPKSLGEERKNNKVLMDILSERMTKLLPLRY